VEQITNAQTRAHLDLVVSERQLLPAGGRLAYSFPLVFAPPLTGQYVRFIFTPLDGKGIGISELQVFEQIEVSPWPADIRLP